MESRKDNEKRELIDYLITIEDPRIERNKEHPLINILMIGVCGMICGAESFVDMEDFGEAKKEWFETFLDLKNGIPSHDTFCRVFGMIKPKEFGEVFMRWTESLRKQVSQEIVAIDGKSIRRSYRADQPAIHIVSAWALENRLVLGQIKTEDKSNEITAIPELLQKLELSGCIVTIDAMGCQKKIATEICNADADYVLALKENHPVLYQEVKTFLEDAKKQNFKDVAHDYFQTIEKDHGRIETRRYWITDQIEWLADKPEWENLHSVGMVESTREINGKVSRETRFYLTSLKSDAKEFARAVRGHWAIENQLHWCLDVSFNEDQCRVRTGFAAQNLAILRQIALNLLKHNPRKRGIKGKRLNASWDNAYLASLLSL